MTSQIHLGLKQFVDGIILFFQLASSLFDVLATTGMAGAGATIQLFTTGLGTPTGNPISPMVKLSTNTKLAKKLPEIIDIDCGPIISGEKTVEQTGEEVLEYIIQLASGEINTKAMDLGQDDFMFWRRGVSL